MKYDHDIIRDLMPLCIDGIASEKSCEAVKDHLAECSECKAEWEQMKINTQPCENIPLPEDTARYTETAKRVKKHRRGVLLKAVCAVILALFIGGLLGNHFDDASFFPKKIARQFIDGWCDLSEAEITFLGTVKSPDGQYEATLALVERPGAPVLFAESTAERSDLLRMGMWSGTGGSWEEFPADKKIFETGCLVSENELKYRGHIAFYVTDDRVEKISFVRSGETYTLYPDKNGFCGIGFAFDDKQQYDSFRISEGTAVDANGKILYEKQGVSRSNINGKEVVDYDWVKVG